MLWEYSALVYWQEEYVGKNEIDDSDASPETKRKRVVSVLILKVHYTFFFFPINYINFVFTIIVVTTRSYSYYQPNSIY